MTAHPEKSDVDSTETLESILRTVRSIDRNVEAILDNIESREPIEDHDYDPAWEYDDYQHEPDY